MENKAPPTQQPTQQQNNRRLAINLTMIVAGMVMLTFASVPLYQLFCKVTGFAGTPQVANVAPSADQISSRVITVRFNTDVDGDLPWEFTKPPHPETVKIGEERLVAFRAKNIGNQPNTGVAVYNITPDQAAIYFNKIQCFCFDNQYLDVGQEANFPVSFFIDPDILNDPELKELETVTLSYTFFKSKKP